MNEIDHKIGIAVKKDCQVTISPLLQHMLVFKRVIFPHGDHISTVWKRLVPEDSTARNRKLWSPSLRFFLLPIRFSTVVLERLPPSSVRPVGNTRTENLLLWLRLLRDIKKREAWVQVDVLFEVNQLQRHTFELPGGYYSSPKWILKAIEGKKHRTPLRKKFESQRVVWKVIHGAVTG
jgi:hypothetical protein